MNVLDEAKSIVDSERRRIEREFPDLADLLKLVETEWKPRMTKVAGLARQYRSGRRQVIMSRFLFSKVENMEHVADVFCHEFAHQVVGGSHGHDSVWKAAAIRIGGPRAANQFHCMQVVSKPQRRWQARCPHCSKVLEITTVRANKMLRGFTYRHSNCGTVQDLVLLQRPD